MTLDDNSLFLYRVDDVLVNCDILVSMIKVTVRQIRTKM